MFITLNGERREFPQPMTLAELIRMLGFEGKPVVIEHNHEAVFPRDYAHVSVQDADRIELVTLAAGG